MYNPRTNTWHAFSSMKNKRIYHGLVGFKSLLYAFGGHDGNSPISSVEYYDPVKDSWNMTTSMPKGRDAHGVCSIDNSIYICGGYSDTYLNNVYKFDPVTGVYLTSQPMKNKRRAFNLAVSDNCIYAIGGCDGNQNLNSMEIFDPREGKWSNGPSMIETRRNHGVAVSEGYIYVSPGILGILGYYGSYWERFNIRGSKWERLTVSNEQGQLNQDGCCYLLGSAIDSLEKFNPKDNSVIEMPPMLNNREFLSATIMDCFEIKHS